jgi:hypothetical protein
MQANGKQTQIGELGKTIDANGWFGNLIKQTEDSSSALILAADIPELCNREWSLGFERFEYKQCEG